MATNSQEYKDGYEAAIRALKDQLNGNNQNNSQQSNGGLGQSSKAEGTGQGSSGSQNQTSNQKPAIGSDGRPMQYPDLNPSDAAKAQRNQKNNQGGSSNGNKPRRLDYTKMTRESAAASTPAGGFISQEEGARIAKKEGYNDEATAKNDSQVASEWRKWIQDAVNNPGSNEQGSGKGIITKFLKDLYYTNYNWKSELRNIIGKSLSRRDDTVKWGKKKILASTGEIRKYFRQGNTAVGSVIFMIDTSGSVSDDLYNRILSECATIVKQKGITQITYVYYSNGIDFIETNNIIKTKGVISQEAVLKIKSAKNAGNIRGQGGTNYGLARKQLDVMMKGIQCPLVMCFTDGFDTLKEMYKPKCATNMVFVIYDNSDFKAADSSKVIRLASKNLGV